jgi:hypothetical protein
MLGMISMPDSSASSPVLYLLAASKSFAKTLDRSALPSISGPKSFSNQVTLGSYGV